MRHLISLGHRRIAFISAPEALTFATERLQGYRQGLEEAGLTWDPSWLAQGDLTRQGGYQTALRLLDLEPRPTRFACWIWSRARPPSWASTT